MEHLLGAILVVAVEASRVAQVRDDTGRFSLTAA
jgi:hypothetical protein